MNKLIFTLLDNLFVLLANILTWINGRRKCQL